MNVAAMRIFLALLFGSALVLGGCDNGAQAPGKAQKKAAAPQAPAPLVDVVTAKAERVALTKNLPGRLRASREAVIVPRISGIVQKRLFVEGAMVQAGTPLYQLDDAAYRAELMSAQARLKQAVANRDLYRATVTRYQVLVRKNAVSRQAYDEARANLKVQEANIAAAEAAIKSAQIYLDYARITAPISGRIGYSEVTEGAYVSASATQMAKIQQLDPLYLDITQSAAEILKRKHAIQEGQLESAARVDILREDGTPYPLAGKLMFVNQMVDEATGEVTVRAEVPNPQGALLPGLYVRALVAQASYPHAYLIPQQAVTLGKVATVLIVKEEGSFVPQPVTVIGRKDTNYVIGSGLEDGDQVIVDGTSALAFGAKKVRTQPWHNPLGETGTGASAQKQMPGNAQTSSAQAKKPAVKVRDPGKNSQGAAASGGSADEAETN